MTATLEGAEHAVTIDVRRKGVLSSFVLIGSILFVLLPTASHVAQVWERKKNPKVKSSSAACIEDVFIWYSRQLINYIVEQLNVASDGFTCAYLMQSVSTFKENKSSDCNGSLRRDTKVNSRGSRCAYVLSFFIQEGKIKRRQDEEEKWKKDSNYATAVTDSSSPDYYHTGSFL